MLSTESAGACTSNCTSFASRLPIVSFLPAASRILPSSVWMMPLFSMLGATSTTLPPCVVLI